MRLLKELKITESIQYKKLVFEESWSDKFDTLTIYFAYLTLAGFALFGFSQIKPSLNSSFEYIILLILLTSSLYIIYCKFTEKKLKEIKFTISKAEAKNRIIKYAQGHNYRISKAADNLIFLNEATGIYSPGNYEQTYIIFLKSNVILYTVIKEGSKSNFTVLFSQHLIKRDFKKMLQKEYIETTRRKNYFRSFFHGL
ncbi:hypothetical protein [Chryseobacterium sp. SIMBA_028]|uniref:hypothetical protein n=2 Tax=Bacteria TaxID=2 RepID=UPI00397D2469